MNVCPVYHQTGGHAYGSVYQGPIGAIITPQLQNLEHSRSLPYASSLCGACYDVCPVKINIPEILIMLRGKIVREDQSTFLGKLHPENMAMQAMALVFASSGLMTAAEGLARVAQFPFVHNGAIQSSSRDALGLDANAGSDAVAEAVVPALVDRKGVERVTVASNNSRTYILNRIKVALDAKEHNRAELCAAEWQEIPRHYRRMASWHRPELISLFDSRLRHYNGTPFYSEGDVRDGYRQDSRSPRQASTDCASRVSARVAARQGSCLSPMKTSRKNSSI